MTEPPGPEPDYRARDAQRRALLTALLKALDEWADISALVAASDDRGEAQRRLVARGFSDEEALYVMDLQLTRLTRAAKAELRRELDMIRDQ